MTVVSLLRCDEYNHLAIKEKIMEGFSHIGIDPSLLNGQRVVIKPNLLSATSVEKAVVTHPEIFRAVVQIVKEHGGTPVMVESPAFQPLNKVMKKTGYDRIVTEEGCEVADTKETSVLYHKGAGKYRRFELASALFDADIVLNLPKFKTHSITYITGAVKNLFGFIHGLNKSQWHIKARTKDDFADFLLDLYSALLNAFERPKRYIHIMDAIIGMEGEGPGSAGDPKKIGALLISEDAVAVDSIAVNLVGLDKSRVKTITFGVQRGLGTASLEKIELRGSSLDDFHIADFVPTRSTISSPLQRWPVNTNLFKTIFVEKPVPSEKRCTLCYQCKTLCPAGAIDNSDGKREVPLYDYGKCIRCYCCIEICPEAAVSLKRGRLQWLIDRNTSKIGDNVL